MDRRRLAKYEVLCRISSGGMSQIFLASKQGLGGFNKLVVLKMILPDIVGEEDFVRMFLDEARITAAFNHPHIAQVYELDTADDVLFIAMEFVQGCTLVEMARACRSAQEPIPIGFTLAAVRDTALALHYAHTFVDPRGRKQVVIHRDVAEKNIMVTYEGVCKLLDFGIAKAQGRSGRTSAGMVKGTSGYMSPEQIRGEPLDPRSDLFSLGVVLHECLTGLRLFHGRNAEEGMMAALTGEVAPPSAWNPLVTPEVDAIALKALQKEREARFGTALEFARAIERAAPGALWHPEESGELVMRYFADRRAETRRVLEASIPQENTSEVRVDSFIAHLRAAADTHAEGAIPNVFPVSPRPQRPPSVAPTAPSPALAPRPVQRVPAADFAEADDESYAKTMPAAALPEELRRRLVQRPSASRMTAGAWREEEPPSSSTSRDLLEPQEATLVTAEPPEEHLAPPGSPRPSGSPSGARARPVHGGRRASSRDAAPSKVAPASGWVLLAVLLAVGAILATVLVMGFLPDQGL